MNLTAEEMNKLDVWKLHGYDQKFDALEKRLAKIDQFLDVLIELQKQTRKDIEANHDKIASIYKMLTRLDDVVFTQKRASNLSINWVQLLALFAVWLVYRLSVLVFFNN